MQDLRYAFRTLVRDRRFAATAIATLALGIAVNTIAFTLLNALALRPIPAPDPDRLMRIYPVGQRGERSNMFSYLDYQDYRSQAGVGSFAAYVPVLVTLGAQWQDDAREVVAYAVSDNYFSLIGAAPVRGRMWSPAESLRDGRIVIISHTLWTRRFGSRADVLGMPLIVNGQTFTIMGVSSKDLVGTEPIASDLWVPLSAQAAVEPGPDLLSDRNAGWLLMAGRLNPGVARAAAQEALALLAHRLASEYPGPSRPIGVALAPGTFFTIDPGLKPVIGLVMGIVALVMLIACANVANLMLARAASRQRELAVRVAIGASRMRLLRMMLTETVLIGVLGGAVGPLLSGWTLRLLYPLGVSLLPFKAATIALDLSPDLSVFAYTLALAIAAGVGFGPALQASASATASALHEDGTVLGAG